MIQIERLRVGSRWMHHKSMFHVYTVTGFGIDTKTNNAVVFYACDDETFSRDIGEFLGHVAVDDPKRYVKRFTLIEEEADIL
jgi:hypothetical protein